MKKLCIGMLYLFASILLSCANQYAGNIDNGGSASEVEGKYAIKGTVVYDCGEPVPGAKVRMRPKGFLALYADKFVAYDTTTDEFGRFYFDTVAADSYTVEINKNGMYGALEHMAILSGDTVPVVLPVKTLSPTGSILGRINLPISDDTNRPYVALYNVDHMVKMPITQDFRFDGVPMGVYSLQIVPSLGSKLVVELHDVNVASDSMVDIGQLNIFSVDFFRGCASRECDSMAIRSILNANGMTGVSVADIATFDPVSGRVIGLDLSRRAINVLTKDIGSLSMLSTFDVRNNRLRTLPMQIGYLRNLETCLLDNNEISELPYEAEYLTSIDSLSVTGNWLCGVQPQLVKWLDLHDGDWRTTQECPRTVAP